MNITRKGDRIRLQLAEKVNGRWDMKFDFEVDVEHYVSLRDHMIKHLQEYKIENEA